MNHWYNFDVLLVHLFPCLFHQSIFNMADNLTPAAIAKKIKENLSNRGGLKSVFGSQFLSKFDAEELEMLANSIRKEMDGRKEAEIERYRELLGGMGYDLVKK